MGKRKAPTRTASEGGTHRRANCKRKSRANKTIVPTGAYRASVDNDRGGIWRHQYPTSLAETLHETFFPVNCVRSGNARRRADGNLAEQAEKQSSRKLARYNRHSQAL